MFQRKNFSFLFIYIFLFSASLNPFQWTHFQNTWQYIDHHQDSLAHNDKTAWEGFKRQMSKDLFFKAQQLQNIGAGENHLQSTMEQQLISELLQEIYGNLILSQTQSVFMKIKDFVMPPSWQNKGFTTQEEQSYSLILKYMEQLHRDDFINAPVSFFQNFFRSFFILKVILFPFDTHTNQRAYLLNIKNFQWDSIQDNAKSMILYNLNIEKSHYNGVLKPILLSAIHSLFSQEMGTQNIYTSLLAEAEIFLQDPWAYKGNSGQATRYHEEYIPQDELGMSFLGFESKGHPEDPNSSIDVTPNSSPDQNNIQIITYSEPLSVPSLNLSNVEEKKEENPRAVGRISAGKSPKINSRDNSPDNKPEPVIYNGQPMILSHGEMPVEIRENRSPELEQPSQILWYSDLDAFMNQGYLDTKKAIDKIKEGEGLLSDIELTQILTNFIHFNNIQIINGKNARFDTLPAFLNYTYRFYLDLQNPFEAKIGMLLKGIELLRLKDTEDIHSIIDSTEWRAFIEGEASSLKGLIEDIEKMTRAKEREWKIKSKKIDSLPKLHRAAKRGYINKGLVHHEQIRTMPHRQAIQFEAPINKQFLLEDGSRLSDEQEQKIYSYEHETNEEFADPIVRQYQRSASFPANNNQRDEESSSPHSSQGRKSHNLSFSKMWNGLVRIGNGLVNLGKTLWHGTEGAK